MCGLCFPANHFLQTGSTSHGTWFLSLSCGICPLSSTRVSTTADTVKPLETRASPHCAQQLGKQTGWPSFLAHLLLEKQNRGRSPWVLRIDNRATVGASLTASTSRGTHESVLEREIWRVTGPSYTKTCSWAHLPPSCCLKSLYKNSSKKALGLSHRGDLAYCFSR